MNNWDPKLHPRDPNDGQFTDKPTGGWVDAVSEAMGFDDTMSNTPAGRASLLRRFRNDLEGAEMSGDSGQERHLTFYHPADGGRAVARAKYKGRLTGADLEDFDDDYEDDDYDEDEEFGFGPGEIASMRDSEIRSALIGEAIGAPVPATIADPSDPDATLMTYIVGDPGSSFDPRFPTIQTSDAGVLLGLFDLLVMNNDRAENWILSPYGIPVGYDHTQTMGVSKAVPDDFGWMQAGAFSRIFFDGPTTYPTRDDHMMFGITGWAPENPLHPDDVEAARARLAPLHANGTITDAEWTQMQQVLSQIGKRAAGKRRLIK